MKDYLFMSYILISSSSFPIRTILLVQLVNANYQQNYINERSKAVETGNHGDHEAGSHTQRGLDDWPESRIFKPVHRQHDHDDGKRHGLEEEEENYDVGEETLAFLKKVQKSSHFYQKLLSK